MFIKQLEIDNFKSFANKVDIPMLKGFTTISGPNGSGKSTIPFYWGKGRFDVWNGFIFEV